MNNLLVAIAVFLFSLNGMADDYRARSIGDVSPNSYIRLIKGSIEQAEPGWEPAPIFYQFFLNPGETRVYKDGPSALTIRGREPYSSWEKDYREVVQLGYRPTLSGMDLFRLGGQFQIGKGSTDKIIPGQPFCVANNLSELMPGGGKPDGSEWPKMRILNVSIGYQTELSTLKLGFVNANTGTDEQYSVDCFSEDKKQQWSVGLIEDIFHGRLLFREAKFIDQGSRTIPVSELANYKLRVMQEIPMGKQYIVNGRLFTADEMTLNLFYSPHCYIKDLDDEKPRAVNKSLGTGPGKVSDLNAHSLSTIESWFHDSRFERRSDTKDNLVVFAKVHTSDNIIMRGLRFFNKSLGGYSIQCSLGANDSLVSIDELNSITRGYISFERSTK